MKKSNICIIIPVINLNYLQITFDISINDLKQALKKSIERNYLNKIIIFKQINYNLFIKSYRRINISSFAYLYSFRKLHL